MQVLELYNFYKNKLDKYNGKDELEMGYVTEKAVVVQILKLLEDILE